MEILMFLGLVALIYVLASRPSRRIVDSYYTPEEIRRKELLDIVMNIDPATAKLINGTVPKGTKCKLCGVDYVAHYHDPYFRIVTASN